MPLSISIAYMYLPCFFIHTIMIHILYLIKNCPITFVSLCLHMYDTRKVVIHVPLLILSGLAEPQHHAGGKQKFYIKLSHPPPEPIPTALSPSNKKNGIHRPVNSLAAFYAIQIVESPVGARPEGSNLGGLRSYSPLRSRSCVLDAILLCHACTREFLFKAQTQAHADACFPI